MSSASLVVDFIIGTLTDLGILAKVFSIVLDDARVAAKLKPLLHVLYLPCAAALLNRVVHQAFAACPDAVKVAVAFEDLLGDCDEVEASAHLKKVLPGLGIRISGWYEYRWAKSYKSLQVCALSPCPLP
jgi:hypothetical protein